MVFVIIDVHGQPTYSGDLTKYYNNVTSFNSIAYANIVGCTLTNNGCGWNTGLEYQYATGTGNFTVSGNGTNKLTCQVAYSQTNRWTGYFCIGIRVRCNHGVEYRNY